MGTSANDPSDTYNAGTTYGYYATVCYAYVSSSCAASITYTTGAGNFTNISPTGPYAADLAGLDWNHFAYFELANGEMVFGFEDGDAVSSEGIGDFNDVIFAVNGNPYFTANTPEPATIAVMGLGLAGLGLLGRRRFGKK